MKSEPYLHQKNCKLVIKYGAFYALVLMLLIKFFPLEVLFRHQSLFVRVLCPKLELDEIVIGFKSWSELIILIVIS